MKVGSVITLFMRISLRWSPFDWSSGHLRIYEENRVCVEKEGYCLCNLDDTDHGLEQSAVVSLPTWGSWMKGFFHFHRVHLYASPPRRPGFNAEGLKIRTEELKAAPSHSWRNWLLSSTSHRTAILLQLKTVLDSASVAVCATVCSVISVREQHSTKTRLFSGAREQKGRGQEQMQGACPFLCAVLLGSSCCAYPPLSQAGRNSSCLPVNGVQEQTVVLGCTR